MAQDNLFGGEIDPEISALLGMGNESQVPSYEAIFGDADAGLESLYEPATEDAGPQDTASPDSGGFPEISKKLEETPHPAFSDPNYYKTALSGEGDISQRVHGILQKYLNTKDVKDRSVFRQQLIPAYWDFIQKIARKAPGILVDSKKFLLRFGILHPTFLEAENRDFFAKIIVENEYNQPVYYLDEWFKAVGTGAIRVSTTDEVQVSRNNESVKIQQLLDKALGKVDGARTLLRGKNGEKILLEKNLQDRMSVVFQHEPMHGVPEVFAPYNDGQKRIFGEIQELLKGLIKPDRELEMYGRDFFQAEEDVKTLRSKAAEEDKAGVSMDLQAVDTEYSTVRQMAKMTIGRQGNHYPILTNEYFHCTPQDVATRENIILQLAKIESIDSEAFCRTYKNRLNRIVPYVVLLPSYGDSGVCWEPFDRYNRATSRGRIAVPMYPKSLTVALLSAIGDLRWQVAKEKASFYWMEEGLTGNYYQWFQKMKFKGDLKEFFIQDYITWMTKESEGTQKLDKEVRGIFWRFMPFTQEVKEKLKTRSFAYQELYQRDLNRAMSDGY